MKFFANGCYLFLLAVMASGLLSCTSAPVRPEAPRPPVDEAMGRASVVTLGSMKLDPAKPSSLSWLSEIEVVGEVESSRAEGVRHMTQSAMERQITLKGYPVLASRGDFQMKAVLVIDSTPPAAASPTLLGKAGVDPGLVGASDPRGKGSLVIELRQGHALRWRGAVQVYILPEYSAEVVADRIEHAVAQLLSTWP